MRAFGGVMLRVVACFSCFVAGSAAAADLQNGAAAGAAPSWAGLYAGSLFGYGRGDFSSSRGGFSQTGSAWGSSSGALLGYGLQSGPFVYGLEGDVTYDSVRASLPASGPLPATGAETLDTERLRGRVGYAVGDFLPYVAGGVALNRLYQFSEPLQQFGQTHEQAGLTVGVGLEWRVVLPILGLATLRGEYVYDSYPARSMAIPGDALGTRASQHMFRVGLITYPGQIVHRSGSEFASWAGDYAGVIGGALWTEPHTSLGGATTTFSANGPEFGVFAGKNFAFGRWVLGFEGATELAGAQGSGPQPGVGSSRFEEFFRTDLRGRAGYAFGRLLPFVTAGVAFGRSEQTDPVTGSERGNVMSYDLAFGGGVEYRLSDRWSTRFDYLYEPAYSKTKTGLDGLALKQTAPAQALRLGLAYYFD